MKMQFIPVMVSIYEKLDIDDIHTYVYVCVYIHIHACMHILYMNG